MSDYTYFLGIICALCATVMFNYAPILQKEGLRQMPEISFSSLWVSIKAFFSNKKWLWGAIIGALGGIPYTLSLNWVGLSVLQPLITFGYLVLIYFAKKRLNESLSLEAKLVVFFLLLTPIFISLANVSNLKSNIDEDDTFLRFLIYNLVLTVVAIISWIAARKRPIILTITTASIFSIGAVLGQAAISSICSLGLDLVNDFQVILNSFLIDSSLRGMVIYAAFAFIVNMTAGFLFQICLQKNKASQSGPIQGTLYILISALGGMYVFGQQVSNMLLYVLGFIFAIIGTITLGKFQDIDYILQEAEQEKGEKSETIE